MTHVTFTDFRANIARHFDQIEANRAELIVTRQNHEPCVIMRITITLRGQHTNCTNPPPFTSPPAVLARASPA